MNTTNIDKLVHCFGVLVQELRKDGIVDWIIENNHDGLLADLYSPQTRNRVGLAELFKTKFPGDSEIEDALDPSVKSLEKDEAVPPTIYPRLGKKVKKGEDSARASAQASAKKIGTGGCRCTGRRRLHRWRRDGAEGECE